MIHVHVVVVKSIKNVTEYNVVKLKFRNRKSGSESPATILVI
jgi:hypothetical protein